MSGADVDALRPGGGVRVLDLAEGEVALAVASSPPRLAARDVAEQIAALRFDRPRSAVRVASLPPSGRPVLTVDGRPATAVVSLSHVDGLVAAAVAEGVGVGIDIVDPAEAGRGLDRWFTPEELALEPDEGLLRARLWAAKEAAFKAAGLDEVLRPRTVEIGSLQPRTFTWTVRGRFTEAAGDGRFLSAGRYVVAVALSSQRRDRTAATVPFPQEKVFA
ncbi:MAG: 4'-phosphopantetheinyl transferase superfamily protein [Planctomycetes bacterium]|nr:4'-phosphopantetheinyl transferase superfamily protein [Planctomycetota bacterium]